MSMRSWVWTLGPGRLTKGPVLTSIIDQRRLTLPLVQDIRGVVSNVWSTVSRVHFPHVTLLWLTL